LEIEEGTTVSTGGGEKRNRDEQYLPDDLAPIRQALITWYKRDHREYPWRKTTNPYAILVSEVMSQQTQLDRVVAAWNDFLEKWPTVEALATAERSAVVGFWTDHSLGYNNRAKYLHEAARQVQNEHDGVFPVSPDGLQELMGVGPYTGNAVASFAFGNGQAVVDTNVRRVVYRAFGEIEEGNDSAYKAAANALMPSGESRVWNNAIMELGGVTCQKTPLCDERECPWREWCQAYQTGDFAAPDVPTQPTFEGSRRQFRGRVVQLLSKYTTMDIDTVGHRIRVDYTPDGDPGREWLQDLLSDLVEDGLVKIEERDDQTIARLK
jgi:A/G-specific adenine glycosylase